VLLVVVGSLGVAARAVDQPPKPAADSKPVPGSQPDTTKPASHGLDALKLPAGAVLVVVEEARDALGLLPRWVVIKPDKYQDLLNQIEQLKAQLKPDKPASP